MLKCFFLIYFWCCDIEMNLQSNVMRAFNGYIISQVTEFNIITWLKKLNKELNIAEFTH